MKLYRTLGLLAVFSIPHFAFAAPPVPPAALGHIEATVSFCAKADSKSADRYKDMGKALVKDMSEKELADARGSDDYKESYDRVLAELGKIPADKAVEACRASLPK